MSTRHASACLLVSGGLDSGVLLQQLLARGTHVVPLYVRCGLQWEAAELYWLRRFLRALRRPSLASLTIVELPMRTLYGAHWSLTGRGTPPAKAPDAAVYLPGRNLLLLSCAGIVCARRGISRIALGSLKGNPFADASPRVLRDLGKLLTATLGCALRIETPLARARKAAIIHDARHAPLQLTVSCLRPQGRRHCGRCHKCAERQRAFRAAGVDDPTRYGR